MSAETIKRKPIRYMPIGIGKGPSTLSLVIHLTLVFGSLAFLCYEMVKAYLEL